MNRNLKLISTKDMTEKDWLAFRYNGVGGSEIGTILGLNQYESNVKLFYKKLGEVEDIPDNIHMYAGRILEPVIADEYWRYYDPEDPDKTNFLKNAAEGKIIRKCHKVNAYIINPKFPHAFASIDRLINKNGTDSEGILECKSINSYSAKSWVEGIPPQYLAQLQHYLMVTELPYGELALLKDGKIFDVFPFERNEEFINYIREATDEFWDLVTRARILKQNGEPYEQLEPSPNNQEAYTDFLKERYKAEDKAIAPNAYYFELAEKIKLKDAELKALDEEIEGWKNEIKGYMKECDVMDFGPKTGKITWKEQKGKESVDIAGLRENHPEIADRYVTRGMPYRVLRLSVKSPKIEELSKLKVVKKAEAA